MSPHSRVARLLAASGVAAALGALVFADVAHWRSSRRRLGSPRDPLGPAVIIVLGFRNRGRTANRITRYRTRAALRSIEDRAASTVLVLCGGAVAGPRPEADILAEHAARLGYDGPVRLDRVSTTTAENVREAIPLVEDASTIRIVSNSLHAEYARAILWRLRPDLGARLTRAREHRFGEIPLTKLRALRRGRRALRLVDAEGRREA